jgi:prepilin-type N-terminal cleavage/methylation domain-containing protein
MFGKLSHPKALAGNSGRGSCFINPRRAFTLVELLVVIAIIGVLVALLLPAVQAAREAARRTQCQNNIKQVLTGMHLFHDAYKEFPACMEPAYTGDPDTDFRHSWVPYILPYIEEQALYDLYDFKIGWREGTNLNLTRRPGTAENLTFLICPTTELENEARNDYGAIPGPGLGQNEGWCPTENWSLGVLIAVPATCANGRPVDDPTPGATNSRISIADVTDGTTYTVMLGECAGRDVRFPPGVTGADANLYWANGDHAYAHHGSSVNIHPRDELYSEHPGGLHLGMADASVRFFNESAPKWVIDAFSTRAGGEALHDKL